MSKVSVVIPVYNVEAYLPACLDSVLSQTLSDIEVLCVDDASPDGCGARPLRRPSGSISPAGAPIRPWPAA